MTDDPAECRLAPIDFYNPEIQAFGDIAETFQKTGSLEAIDLYLILDWKAPRARTRHLCRLAKLAEGSFPIATQRLARELFEAPTAKERLELLLGPHWGFRLPTASAILTVLYPEDFTVYDVRVCQALNDFTYLANVAPQKIWEGYRKFVVAVRTTAPAASSLRDGDRWIWGQNKRDQLLRELAKSVQKIAE